MSLQEKWFEAEKAKLLPVKNRKAKRQYLHFDDKIKELTSELARHIWDPKAVAKHGFFPFIRYVKKTPRKRRIKGTRKNKTSIKERPIDYAAHLDALIYSWYAEQLSSRYEEKIRINSLYSTVIAYRSLNGRNNIDFAMEVFEFLKMHPTYEVVTFDIKEFYQRLEHKRLKSIWRDLLGVSELPADHYAVFKAITTSRLVSAETLRKVFKNTDVRGRICTIDGFKEKVVGGGLLLPHTVGTGVPQGSPISCVLSNAYMLPLDVSIKTIVESVGGLYRRYSDDIVIAAPQLEMDKCRQVLERAVAERALALNHEKTEVRRFVKNDSKVISVNPRKNNIASPFAYLGLEFDGESVYLRHAGLARFQRRMTTSARGFAIWARKNNRPLPTGTLKKKYTREGKENYLRYADAASKRADSKAIRGQTAERRVVRLLKTRVRSFRNRY